MAIWEEQCYSSACKGLWKKTVHWTETQLQEKSLKSELGECNKRQEKRKDEDEEGMVSGWTVWSQTCLQHSMKLLSLYWKLCLVWKCKLSSFLSSIIFYRVLPGISYPQSWTPQKLITYNPKAIAPLIIDQKAQAESICTNARNLQIGLQEILPIENHKGRRVQKELCLFSLYDILLLDLGATLKYF